MARRTMMLRGMGLGSAVQQVYAELWAHRGITVAELAGKLSWSLQRVQECLDELSRLALVRWSLERPGEPYLASPELGLSTLLAQQEAELFERQKELAETRASVTEIITAFRDRASGNSLDGRRLVGADEVRDQVDAFAHEVEKEIMAFAVGGDYLDSLEHLHLLGEQVLSRGVRARFVYLQSASNDRSATEYATWLHERGGEIRMAPVLPLPMVIADCESAVVPMGVDSPRDAVLVREPGVVSALCALFESYWERSSPFGATNERDDHELTRMERAVLALLSEGHTDEVVARKLGVSVRTSRRLTADLLSRLNARSRFQAGLLVERAGWLAEGGDSDD